MSKKLKKKIEEICGFEGLDWEARQTKATQILESTEWKQSICNELLGLSFKDLERTLRGIATERKKKEESYEHKLEAYRRGNTKAPKQLHAHSSKGGSAGNERSRPRTLKEILAQVYAPRVVQAWGDEEQELADGMERIQSISEILPKPDGMDSGAEE